MEKHVTNSVYDRFSFYIGEIIDKMKVKNEQIPYMQKKFFTFLIIIIKTHFKRFLFFEWFFFF